MSPEQPNDKEVLLDKAMFSNSAGKRPATAEDELLQKAVHRAQLTHDDMVRLRKLFQDKDSDKSGTLDIDEFYSLFAAKKSPFGDALFKLVDVGGDGDFLSFSEFVEVVTTYCLFGASDILRFAFRVVDEDNSGFVSMEELDKLADFLHKDGPANLNTALARIRNKYDKGDGEVSWENFVQMHREFPFLLHPAFELQEYMMNTVLGRRWWDRKKKALGLVKDGTAAAAADDEPGILGTLFPSIFGSKKREGAPPLGEGDGDGDGDGDGGVTAGGLPPPGPELRAHRENVKTVAIQAQALRQERRERKNSAAEAKRRREAEQLLLARERMHTRRTRALTKELVNVKSPLLLIHKPRPVSKLF